MTPEEKKRDTELYEAITAVIDDLESPSLSTRASFALDLRRIQILYWPDGVRTPNDPD